MSVRHKVLVIQWQNFVQTVNSSVYTYSINIYIFKIFVNNTIIIIFFLQLKL